VTKHTLLWKVLSRHKAAQKNSIQVHKQVQSNETRNLANGDRESLEKNYIQVHLVARHDHKPKAETQVRVASHQTSAVKRNEALGERPS